jgi:hypothetical protein
MTREGLLKHLAQLGLSWPEISRRRSWCATSTLSRPDCAANAEHIDRGGLFIGNHHYPIDEAITALSEL